MVDQARAGRHGPSPRSPANAPIVGLEPSCLFALKDEVPSLLPGAAAQAAAARAMLLGEFLAKAIPAAQGDTRRRPCPRPPPPEELRRLPRQPGRAPAGAGARGDADQSCCGMAGAFGYQAETQDASRAMAGQACCRPCARRRRRPHRRRRPGCATRSATCRGGRASAFGDRARSGSRREASLGGLLSLAALASARLCRPRPPGVLLWLARRGAVARRLGDHGDPSAGPRPVPRSGGAHRPRLALHIGSAVAAFRQKRRQPARPRPRWFNSTWLAALAVLALAAAENGGLGRGEGTGAASPLCPARTSPTLLSGRPPTGRRPPARPHAHPGEMVVFVHPRSGLDYVKRARWRWRGSGCRCAAGRCGWTGRRRRGRSGPLALERGGVPSWPPWCIRRRCPADAAIESPGCRGGICWTVRPRIWCPLGHFFALGDYRDSSVDSLDDGRDGLRAGGQRRSGRQC